jgi:murein L,D-transpeptidase YafK
MPTSASRIRRIGKHDFYQGPDSHTGPDIRGGLGDHSCARACACRKRQFARTPVVQNNSRLQLPLTSPTLVVKKAERRLLVYSNNKLVRTYRIGLGLSPVGDKVRSGDHRTPEGDYYVFTKNDKSAYYLSLGISYPNIVHAERGLRDGLITRAQYDAIVRANKAKKTPPQNTRLGGTIYIHGNGASSDWTWGCVALENEDIRELFNAISVGTPVRIEP